MNNNFDWLCNNVKIFLDQNIPINTKNYLITKGFRNIQDVYCIGFKGANDGKILEILKENKLILVTKDIKFSKMCNKYNKLSILIINKHSPKSIGNYIIKLLINKYSSIKDYYDNIYKV